MQAYTLLLTVPFLALSAAATCGAGVPPQTTFATPEAAAHALLDALASDDYPSFLSVAGRQMAGFWGREVSEEPDTLERVQFLETARRSGMRTDRESAVRSVLYVGHTQQPFPAPLVKTDWGWRFDDEAGARELVLRRWRRNETAAVEMCRRFREAEFEYRAISKEGPPEFAERIRSTPGQRDGLFWESADGDESPLGPPFAAAAFGERRANDGTRPLFGYFFKILTSQGPDAAGGALDYRTNGRLRKGFALVAWPAEYGVDGVQTFVMNHFGDVYEQDLGEATGEIAGQMLAFNPDRKWSRHDARD